ncbi:MAG TPA: hypothetical protein RMH99_09585 [Sandaracinaceae bacterium LLY-WYZ-13_1]|nr:hypothetical protein [Sandaracinaceae bacterium LLY-WYZ-13_1]
MTYLTAPETAEALDVQLAATMIPVAPTALATLIRLVLSIGADPCDEVCHELSLGVPLLAGALIALAAGALADESIGPPAPPTMSGPLVVRF